jgi:hypothetical protein
MGVFLLDDADVERLRRRLTRRPPPAPAGAPAPRPARRTAALAGVALFLALSLLEGLYAFTAAGPLLAALEPAVEAAETFRLVNTYHLFASITRERNEPELQTLPAGADPRDDAAFVPHHLRHKPGDVRRAPDFVAPHQPRVDFQLWFHGLRFRAGQPPYLSTLLERMCEDPAAVQPLFRDPLPPHPAAVRVVYWQFHFTTPAERRATGAWWRRTRLGATRPLPCPSVTAP